MAGDEKQGEIKKCRIKEKLSLLENNLNIAQDEIDSLMRQIPNPPFDDVPEGINETENVVLREVGEKPNSSLFKPKDYLTIAQDLGIIDVERAGKVSGSRFGYLKNEAAFLDALVQLGMLPELIIMRVSMP